MDYQELLFAAEVRKAAVQMYLEQRKSLTDNLPDGPSKELLIADWEVQHPFEYWFEEAFKSINWAAEVVRDLQKKRDATGA